MSDSAQYYLLCMLNSCVYTDEATIIKGAPMLLKVYMSLTSRLKPGAPLMTAYRCTDCRFSKLGDTAHLCISPGGRVLPCFAELFLGSTKTLVSPFSHGRTQNKWARKQPKWKRDQDLLKYVVAPVPTNLSKKLALGNGSAWMRQKATLENTSVKDKLFFQGGIEHYFIILISYKICKFSMAVDMYVMCNVITYVCNTFMYFYWI